MKKWTKQLCSAVLCLILLLAAIPASVYGAAAYQPDRTGSITIRLADIGTEKTGTSFALYQVGTITGDTHLAFALTGEFAGTGIDLNRLHQAEAQKQAANICMSMLPTAADAEQTAGTNGTVTFPALTQGVYLVCQTNEAGYGTVEPFLVFLPYINEQNDDWVYDITTAPKAEKNETYSLTITKLTKYKGGNVFITQTFYAAMFADAACTERVGSVIELKLEKSNTVSVTVDNLKAGTYYLAETDEYGKVLDTATGALNFTNEIENGVITLPGEQTTAAAMIVNSFIEPPVDALYEGQITLDKTVMDINGEINVTDTFYFTLFSDEEMTMIINTQTLSLNQESGGTVIFSNLPFGVYYIAETDEYGFPVDESFAYTVSINAKTVTLAVGNENGAVTVINSRSDETTETDENEETNNGTGDTGPRGKPATPATMVTKSGSPKTGDSTRMLLYITGLLAACGVFSGITINRRKNKMK